MHIRNDKSYFSTVYTRVIIADCCSTSPPCLSQRESFKKNAEKQKKEKMIRDLMSLMGVANRSAAETRLQRSKWDYEKAAQDFLAGVIS